MTEVYEIIKQSLDTCTRMTEASKVDEATRVANKIVKLKDNPVPSILVTFDKNENVGYIESVMEDIVRNHRDSAGPYLKCKLQNGVETNKEQP